MILAVFQMLRTELPSWRHDDELCSDHLQCGQIRTVTLGTTALPPLWSTIACAFCLAAAAALQEASKHS